MFKVSCNWHEKFSQSALRIYDVFITRQSIHSRLKLIVRDSFCYDQEKLVSRCQVEAVKKCKRLIITRSVFRGSPFFTIFWRWYAEQWRRKIKRQSEIFFGSGVRNTEICKWNEICLTKISGTTRFPRCTAVFPRVSLLLKIDNILPFFFYLSYHILIGM